MDEFVKIIIKKTKEYIDDSSFDQKEKAEIFEILDAAKTEISSLNSKKYRQTIKSIDEIIKENNLEESWEKENETKIRNK